MARPEKNFDDQTPPTEALPAAAVPGEKPPFSGFLPRLGAFLLDCALIYFIYNGLDLALHPALLQLNPLLPYLAFLPAFLYFWIGAGPLTQGRSLGKVFLSLRVVAADGLPLGWDAAFRRTLLQFPVFLVLLIAGRPYTYIFPTSLFLPVTIAIVVLALMGLIYLVALTLGMAFHPLKQGWHDVWARSWVTPRETPEGFRFARETAAQDFLTQRRVTTHRRMSLILWAVATVVLVGLVVRDLSKAKFKEDAQPLLTAQKDLTLPDYRVTNVMFPELYKRFTPDELMAEIARVRNELRTQGKDVPSTQTMITQTQTIVAEIARTRGPVPADAANDAALRNAIELLRVRMWQSWLASPDRKTSSTLNVASDFHAVVIEPMTMMMYHMMDYGKPKLTVHGPADPARGGLIFDHVLPSVPKASDRATTTSATPTALPTHAAPRS